MVPGPLCLLRMERTPHNFLYPLNSYASIGYNLEEKEGAAKQTSQTCPHRSDEPLKCLIR